MKKGGHVLAPGNPQSRVQWIDVRDLASWVLNLAENKHTGVYHATGPSVLLTMKQFLKACKDTLNPTAQIQWVSEQFLTNQGVAYWSEMPLWIPKEANMDGFLAVDNRKAIKAGLTFRPIQETIRDTTEWLEIRPTNYKWKAGMDAKREKELLTLYGNKNE
jgi:2'-hydroxyisoflavone reductase